MSAYIAVLVLLLVAAAIAGAFLAASMFFGPRATNPTKAEPFEAGSVPIGSTRERFPVRFYVIALLFVVFDIEAVFLYPWAVLYRKLGTLGLIEMGVFVAILAAGLVYVWKKGALEWE